MTRMPEISGRADRPYWICLALAVLALSVYWQVKGFEFVNYDDTLYGTENPVVQSGLNPKSIVWAFKTTSIANWHPVTWLSHLLDAELYGRNPAGHHGTNLIIHIVNPLLLFWPYLCVGWLWFLGTLVPVIGLVQIGSQAMADRYTYVPLIGLFVMVSWGGHAALKGWRHHRTLLATTGTGAVLVLAAVAWNQAGYWRDSATLFAHALEVTSNNYIAHNNLGIALHEAGRPEAAIRHYQKSLEINPMHAPAHNNWGNALSGLGKLSEAADQYAAAVRTNPRFAEAYYNLGNCRFRQNRLGEAARCYRQALQLDPLLVGAHNNLGTVSALQGKMAEAILHYRQALAIDPAFFEASKNLALIHASYGDYDAARSVLMQSLAVRPEGWEAYYYMAGTYACQDNIDQSVKWLSKAVGAGFSDWQRLRRDPSLEKLRTSTFYQELIRGGREAAEESMGRKGRRAVGF